MRAQKKRSKTQKHILARSPTEPTRHCDLSRFLGPEARCIPLQDRPTTMPPSKAELIENFKKFDANEDGYISAEELMAILGRNTGGKVIPAACA